MLYVVQKDSFRTPPAANHAAHHDKKTKSRKSRSRYDHGHGDTSV